MTSTAIASHALQRNALHELHARLGTGRGVVVMPCGAGKTLLGRWYAAQLAARVTVVFVPSLALIAQTLTAWRSDTSWRHESMIVCSDQASGRSVAVDDLQLPDWARGSVEVSTSPNRIAAFLSGGGAARVIVATYHSAPRVAAGLAAAGLVADLVVCDEAHRLTGQPRREFRAVLDDDSLPARRRVFLTATPVEAAAWAADVDVDEAAAPLSLDDEELFGPTLYRATFADAIAAGRLVDYDVEVLTVRGGPDVDQPGPAAAVVAAVEAGSRRILTFHSRVASARELAEHVDGTTAGALAVRAEHLEARHGTYRRQAALHRLAHPADGAAVVLASARLLSEGVDVPAVDTVVFAEPRSSAVDIVQAVGRAMRTAPGKTRGRVVLAVTLDDATVDEDTALSSTSWRHVWTTLRALAAMDPRFAKRLRALAMPNPDRREGIPAAGPGLRLDLPDGVDLRQWALRALDRTGGSWWACYDLIAAHARQYGAARPHQQARRGGIAIGTWVARQRTLYRQGTLEPERVDALEQLPGWAWDRSGVAFWHAAARWHRDVALAPTDPGWWDHLAEIPGFGKPSDRPAKAYDSLAVFAADTAARHRHGTLPAYLAAAAEHLDGWTWGLLDADDAAMVDALDEYADTEDDLSPHHAYLTADGEPLGAWLTAVRRRNYTGRLHPVLRAELELLGNERRGRIQWERGATSWRLGYLALRQFVARERTARIPYQHVEALPDHELNLSRWCVVQRQSYRQGGLAPDRVAALEAVAGWEWEIPVLVDHDHVLHDVEHGQRWAYARGCRCVPCCEANREYERARANGEYETELVDAGPARAHLKLLLARGAGQKPLARAAGINVKSIVAISEGQVSRIRPEREQLILQLTVDAAQENTGAGLWGETVDMGPTQRLIDWMVMRGWPKAWISAELGGDGRALQLGRGGRISKQKADLVSELDRRLGRTRRPPPRRRGEVLPTLDQLLAAGQEAS